MVLYDVCIVWYGAPGMCSADVLSTTNTVISVTKMIRITNVRALVSARAACLCVTTTSL